MFCLNSCRTLTSESAAVSSKRSGKHAGICKRRERAKTQSLTDCDQETKIQRKNNSKDKGKETANRQQSSAYRKVRQSYEEYE